MKLYLAAPIFDPVQLSLVKDIKTLAERHEHEVFSPYHNSQEIWQGRAPRDCTAEERALVLSDNINNIDWCDCLLAWVGGMGGFTDPGVVWELGYAYAKRKLLLAYIDDSDERASMNLMLAGTIDAVAKGISELDAALGLLPTDAMLHFKKTFDPDRHLAHEKEPIV